MLKSESTDGALDLSSGGADAAVKDSVPRGILESQFQSKIPRSESKPI